MPTLTLLGSPILADDLDLLVTGRPTQRHCLALLALLAGERRGLPRERAIDYLWPDCDARTGRHRLSVALHVIRSRLGDHAIVSSGDAVSLPDAGWRVDVWDYESDVAAGRFESACTRFRGRVLDGFFLRHAPEFDRWLEAWRGRLERRHRAVLKELALQAERDGDVDGAVEYWRELSARDPASGAETLALMHALSAAGRSAEAIRCARAYTLVVRDDYGLDPDPAVLACAEHLAPAWRHAGDGLSRPISRPGGTARPPGPRA